MNTISVMLVDKNPTFMHVVKQKLHACWQPNVIVVGTSPGGDDALDQAPILQPRIILLGLDHQNLDNLHLIRRFRGLLSEVGIIALGSLDVFAHQQAALAAGADAFVAKMRLDIALLPTIWNIAENVSIGIRRPDVCGMVRMVGFRPAIPTGEYHAP